MEEEKEFIITESQREELLLYIKSRSTLAARNLLMQLRENKKKIQVQIQKTSKDQALGLGSGKEKQLPEKSGKQDVL